ncbi:MAG: universal stress protein [Flavobacteriaceae bacterium]|nr:universal stress protein [Flavobacteriaceae bacterium]
MKNILIPTDFSENSWNAIEYALAFFKKTTCSFYVLHVNTINNLANADTSFIQTQDVIEEAFIQPSRKKLQQLLKRVEHLPLNTKHQFFTLTDYNFFIDSIRKHVKENKIDCIVIGTKGATGLKKLIIGSNTGNIITKVQCTTLVVPENAKYVKPKEIAFPTGFSFFYSMKTLQPITEIIEMHDAAVRILHVNKRNAVLNDDQVKNKEYLEEYFNDYEHSFHFLTNKHIEDAIQCFVESRDINLIAMVAKNLNYFQKLLFHPTVEEISYYTDIPFLVLHE